MRIAFYAPLKAPTHGTPSGDRRVAGLLMEALQLVGHRVELVSSFRSYDGEGDEARQRALRDQGEGVARRLVERWRNAPQDARPDLWFTYHLYYKAPDWLGPAVSAAIGIPYVVAEASYAPKRAGGPWSFGHEAAARAIRSAQLVLSPTRYDMDCLEGLLADGRERLVHVPPFLDPAPFRAAARDRATHRGALAESVGLDARVPWLAIAAMMRSGDKLASYTALSSALARLSDLPWQLLVAGDGPARPAVEAALGGKTGTRTRYLGELRLGELARVYGASDLCVWPAVNEAYGMAMLEAQAAGLPVVSCELRGVPDVVCDGETGLLAPPGDDAALAGLVRELLTAPGRRLAMGRAAAEYVSAKRSLEAAAHRIDAALRALLNGTGVR